MALRVADRPLEGLVAGSSPKPAPASPSAADVTPRPVLPSRLQATSVPFLSQVAARSPLYGSKGERQVS